MSAKTVGSLMTRLIPVNVSFHAERWHVSRTRSRFRVTVHHLLSV